MVLIGFLSSDKLGSDYFHLEGSGATARAVGVGGALEDLVPAGGASGLEPVIDRTFAFEDAREAVAHLGMGGTSARWSSRSPA